MKLKLNNILLLSLATQLTLACSDSDELRTGKVNPPKVEMSKVSDDKADELRANVLDQQIRDLEARLKKSDEKNDEILASLEELHQSRNSLAPRSVTFSKNLLGKDILLNSTYFASTRAANPSSFDTKIVNMKIVGNRLVITESLKGQLQTDNIPTEKLNIVLPIIEASEDDIKVDFVKGMKSLTLGIKFSGEEIGIAINDSYLKQVKSYEDEAVMIDSVARYETPEGVESIVFKLTFEKLVENPNFKSVKNSDLEKNNIRFFDTDPIWEAGAEKPYTYAMKWDTSKTVPFHYSQNFPEEYLDALQASFTYWNTLYGKEVLTLEKLPDGVVANDRGYNVVQWLAWDAAGSARADFKANPRTGELLQATLHITSVFAKSRGLTRRLGEILETKEPASSKAFIELPGHNHHDCNVHDLSDLQKSISEMDLKNYSEEELENIEKDLVKMYLTETIAHEIGHALGLRHNFASSAQSELLATDYDAQMKELIENKKLLKKNIATSTMDYTRFWDAAMSGFMVYTNQPLAYDQKAIKYAYDGIPEKPTKEEKAILFCSDEEADSIIDDCRRFDRYADKVTQGYIEAILGAERQGKSVVAKATDFLNGKEGAKAPNPVELGTKFFNWYMVDVMNSMDSRTILLQSPNAAKVKRTQVAALPGKDGAIFDLISAFMTVVYNSSIKAAADLPEETTVQVENKKETIKFLGQFRLIAEASFMKQAVAALSTFNYGIEDAESYKKSLMNLSSLIMNTSSGINVLKNDSQETEGDEEKLTVDLPLFDLTSNKTLRLAFVKMLTQSPPLYSEKTFKILMNDLKEELTETVASNIENKFEKGLALEATNLDLIDQLAVEKEILQTLQYYW